eukprot:1989986-Prorocentrum_lima.AAC.1
MALMLRVFSVLASLTELDLHQWLRACALQFAPLAAANPGRRLPQLWLWQCDNWLVRGVPR